MDHVLKEYLDELNEQQQEILESLDLIKERLGIMETNSEDEENRGDTDKKNELDF